MSYFESSAGKVYFEIHGSGEPLIFVHGRTLDRRMWLPQMECFKTKYKCIAYDLNGFGKSSIPKDGYNRALTLQELLQHLQIKNTNFVGLSLGANVLLELILKEPSYFNRMVLMSPAVPGLGFGQEFMGDWNLVENAGKSGDFELAKKLWIECKAFKSLGKTNPINYKLLEEMISDYTCWDLYNAPKSNSLKVDSLDIYKTIQTKTLLIYGEEDYGDFRTNVEFLNATIPNSKAISIPNSSHMINLEQPDLINRYVEGFLAVL